MKIIKIPALWALFLAAALSAMTLAATSVAAQGVDIIRGRVMSDTTPVQGVLVTATTLSGDATRTARTDKNGRYTISFPGGEGDYWVTFTSLGFSPRRYEVKRTADQEILIADARLAPSAVNLAALTITDRVAASRTDTVSDVGGTEKSLAIDAALLTAEQMGDLAAMAASIPGVQLIPGADGSADAFSVFGLGGDQNNTQLNGLSFGDSNIPRDAAVSASLVTSPYDVARGGFSGGQLQLRTQRGSNFKTRRLSSNIITPQLEWYDRVGAAAGQQYTRLSVGGSASGPIQWDRLFYNSSFQLDRRTQDIQTLLNTNDLGLVSSGVASDSVQRFLGILGNQHVPIQAGDFPGQNTVSTGSFLSSFDYNQANSNRGNTYSFAVSSNANYTQPANSSLLSTPSRSGTRLNWSASAQGRHSGLLGWKGILTESNFGYSTQHNKAEPYYTIPAGSVRVNSLLSDGSSSIQNLNFGGSTNLNTSSSNTTLGFSNTLSWFSPDNRHRVKLTSELRREDNSQDLTQNQFGTFSFNSLADLEAGIPASFTRQLSPRRRDGAQVIGALSLGDAWRPVNDLQVQYGLRMDANKYLIGPAENPAVTAAFGLSNTDVPSRVYISPRVGFSWTYGTSNQVTLIPGMVRAPRAVIRGGVGVFQNTPGTTLIGGAIDNTGLPSGLQQLTCLGTAAPVPNWNAYAIGNGSIPTTCADGSSGTVFSNSTPNVLIFEPDYAAQRSLRGNLSWSGAILKNLFAANVDATVSKNFSQAAGFDLNFPGVQQFSLSNEMGRPIYVDPSAIVSTSGQIAWRNSRVFPQFGRVTEQRSDLQSLSKQLTVGIRPIAFTSNFGWSLSYVLSDVREQYFGFNSTTANPAGINWSASAGAPRHQIQYSLNYNMFDVVRISWSGNLRSGTHYTPQVQGDVNGDSYNNDRAYIFDPASTADPAVASGLQSLLDHGTSQAVSCLKDQLGQLAKRNSCTSGWTTTANLNISFNSLRIGLPQRATLNLSVANPLSGLDRLMHGEDNIRGWGMNIQPDQSLLYVRGFDPASKEFKYEVNQRFGSTRPSQTTFRQPASITLTLRYDLGPTRERYQLLQQLDRGRSHDGNKANAQQLRGTANVGIINPMQQILVQSDSLKLTRKQADSLAILNRHYVLKQDSIWAPVARHLAELPTKYDEDDAYYRYKKSREATIDLLLQIAPGIKGLLTPEQFRLLPTNLAAFLDARTLKGLRSGTAGGNSGGGGGFGGGGGGGGGGGRGRGN